MLEEAITLLSKRHKDLYMNLLYQQNKIKESKAKLRPLRGKRVIAYMPLGSIGAGRKIIANAFLTSFNKTVQEKKAGRFNALAELTSGNGGKL